MKKLLAIVLALALCLSFSAMAFADAENPWKEPLIHPSNTESAGSSSAMAAEPNYTAGGVGSTAVNDADLAQAEGAMDAAEALGYTPVEVKVVDVQGDEAEVEIELLDGQVVLIFGKDGKLLKMLTAADVEALGGKIIVTEPCTVVIATK